MLVQPRFELGAAPAEQAAHGFVVGDELALCPLVLGAIKCSSDGESVSQYLHEMP